MEPLLQNRMVDLPPAINIFGIIAAGVLFGIAGVSLATPLTIVILVLVRQLYLGQDKQEVLASGDAPAAPPPSPAKPGDLSRLPIIQASAANGSAGSSTGPACN